MKKSKSYQVKKAVADFIFDKYLWIYIAVLLFWIIFILCSNNSLDVVLRALGMLLSGCVVFMLMEWSEYY